MWDKLSMADRAKYIQLGVANGVTDLSTIRNTYNKYKGGGPLESNDEEYLNYMLKLSEKKGKDWGIDKDVVLTQMLNSNDYNYKAFYDNDRRQALQMLTADPEAHFSDIGKTVYHPTFSNESIYSGKKSDYNPRGTIGGKWSGNAYIPSYSQYMNNDFNYKKTKEYLKGSPEFISEVYNNTRYLNKYDEEGSLDDGNLNYPETTIEKEPWADSYFRNNLNVAGMAIGGGMNGVGGPRRVIINPYSKGINRNAVLKNERLRHYFEETNFKLDNVSKDQMNKYKGTPYEGDTLNIGRTEAARYLTGDANLLSNEQKARLDSLFNKYDEGGIKDSWKPWYWFTPKYEGNNLKEVLFKAYDDGLEGKDILYNNKAYKVALNDSDLNEYKIRKQHKLNRSITPEQVVDSYIDNVLYTMENPNNAGYRGGKYYPYADISSLKNLGPGINYTSDMAKGLDFSGKKGYTKEELNKKARPYLLENMENIMSDLHDMYGEDIDTLSLGNRMILLDIAHNVRPRGSKRNNMPKKWPSLVNGMAIGDLEEIKKNTNSGSTRRQYMRNDLIWKNLINTNTVKNR